MNPNRLGLTFNQQHISATAEDNSDHIADAFAVLTDTRHDNPLVHAYNLGLRHRFMNDSGSGEQAINLIGRAKLAQADNYLHAIRQTLAWVSVAEMVRDLPAWQHMETAWFTEQLRPMIDDLNQPPDSATLLDKFWLGAFNVGAGIVLNDDAIFALGQDIYQDAIANHIHPEGYLRGLVDEEDATDTYLKQVSATAALTVTAEMAQQADVNLWAVDNRGITPITAATYTLYYFYYPERWQWEDGLTPETTNAIMTAEGAFIEMSHRRSPLRAIEQLLDDLRPMFNIYSGGLTTLTHGTPAPRKKKRWSLFGG